MRSVQLRRLGAVAILLTAILAHGPACGPARAAGPSFSCDKASAPVDRAICGDAELSALDLTLERAFRAALASDPAGHDEMLKAQRRWLKGRADACHLARAGEGTKEQVACLTGLMKDRIAGLQPRDPRDVILAGRIADEIRLMDGYVGQPGSLVEALGKDADSPVRFTLGDKLTKALTAKLPGISDDLEQEGKVYRLTEEPATLAVAATGGTAHCWSYGIFREVGGQYEALSDPDPGEEGTHCGDDIGFGRTATAGGDPGLLLFADATYALDRPTMLLVALHGDRWRRVGAFALHYETALAMAARSCAAQAACADLAADALDLARARDAAGASAPDRLGAAARTAALQEAEQKPLPVFGKDKFGAWSDFETDAPVYKLATTSGTVAMRISHATIGWRTNEDYIVAAYRDDGGTWHPIAGFQIAKSRVRLRAVTVE